MLQSGEIIRVGKRAYRVEYVNQSRAYCIPFTEPKEGERENKEEVALDEAEGLTSPGQKSKSRTPGSINISPNSFVERITADQAGNIVKPDPNFGKKGEYKMAVAAIPVATKTARAKDIERRANKSTRSTGGNAKIARNPKPPKEMHDCLCGCNEKTASFFCIGHDSRFKSRMMKVERGEMEVKDLPKSVQKAYDFKKRGDGFVTVKNYKGEAHSGYAPKE